MSYLRRDPYGATAALAVNPEDHEMSGWLVAIALACGVWYFFILVVQTIGFTQLYRYYSSRPKPSVSATLNLENVPHVTILRPVKGLEPQLYECLAATFLQDYPRECLTIYFCIASALDPAYPVLQRLLADFSGFDVKILIEEEDPNLSGHGGERHNLGPNPKIRNMSRGYREAKGDLIWIIDCNVWVGKGVTGRMVDKLCGFGVNGTRVTPFKFVHQLPLVVDIVGANMGPETRALLGNHDNTQEVSSANNTTGHISAPPKDESQLQVMLRTGGGRLEEMFMASSHAKFYSAINTVAVAPCIVGKSNMFRKSHLDYLTSGASPYSPGIDYFSENICEDHLIGDLLWRKKVQEEKLGQKFYKHGLVLGDLAIQPMAGMSVREYIGRRVRWLRVRKWTVTLATLVEPGVEPLLCSAYGAFAVTTLPWCHDTLKIPQTWLAFLFIWLSSIFIWMSVDTLVYAKLHSATTVELDADTPKFARPPKEGARRRFSQWIGAWLGREFLALPIWIWACLGGTTVMWRGKKFRVNLNMKVVEMQHGRNMSNPEVGSPRSRSKDRLD